MRTRLLALLMAVLMLASPVFGQQLPEPEPYDPAEVPGWARDLRRFEVLFFGSLPLTYMVGGLGYDFALFAANGFSTEYALGTQRGTEDFRNILIISAGLSLTLARRPEPEP